MNISSLSSEVFISRDAIRTQLIKEFQKSLDLVDVDLTKSSFLSYIINILSTLTANIIFYQISVYKEFFLTKAQLDESVINGAASIGYKPNNAKYSKVSLILSFPLRFTSNIVKFEFPKNTVFKISHYDFLIDYSLKFIITANSSVQCFKYMDNNVENVPCMINTAKNTFNVMINLKQLKIDEHIFSVSNTYMEYRFTEYNISFTGQLADINVEVINQSTGIIQKYIQFSSIYLMSSNDYGFVVRKTNDGCKILFGNGLIGKQPEIGSTVNATVYTTLGEHGNVITGTIQSQPHINSIDQDGIIQKVNYTSFNPSPAINGKDEPTLEEIKYEAINNLTSLNRLVSEDDYKHIGSLKPESSIAERTYPVLKRSDIRTNEIQIFQLLKYNHMVGTEFILDIVPTENIYFTIDSTADLLIEKLHVFEFDNIEYISPFEIIIDPDLEITKYKYITTSVKYNLTLSSTGILLEDYVFYGTYLLVETSNNKVILKLYYSTEETDADLVSCNLEVTNTLINMPMQHDLVNNVFQIEIEPYDRLPENVETYYFTFNHSTLGRLNQYSVIFAFRYTLDHVMLSNTFINDDNTISVYDVPVIKKDYYDSLDDKQNFEYYVLQKMIDNIDYKDIRMITDFMNLKFANTSYQLKNMLLNRESRLPVDYIGLETFEHPPIANERFIISGTELPEWSDKTGQIAICNKGEDSTSSATWSYVIPEMDDIIFAMNTNKKYIYTSCEWIEPIFEIPLLIEADVKMKDNYSIDTQAFVDTIKSEIIEKYTERMVCQSSLSRSELIYTIQNVDGVDHCKLKKPISNIFYNFRLEELSNDELLHYTPELLYFNESNITIRMVQ